MMKTYHFMFKACLLSEENQQLGHHREDVVYIGADYSLADEGVCVCVVLVCVCVCVFARVF